MILFLIALVAVPGYLISLYLWPLRPCRACGATGRNRGSSRRRFGQCRRCNGSRHVQRLGARALHRAVRTAASWRSR